MKNNSTPGSSSPRGIAPCGHAISPFWDGCDYCASDFVDRRDGYPLGRYSLYGARVGLAVDFSDEGRVLVYMLHADTFASDSSGVWSVWVDSGVGITSTPDVILVDAATPLPPGATAEDYAHLCEFVSEISTALLSFIWESFEAEGGFDSDASLRKLEEMLLDSGASPRVVQLFWMAFDLLMIAMRQRIQSGGVL